MTTFTTDNSRDGNARALTLTFCFGCLANVSCPGVLAELHPKFAFGQSFTVRNFRTFNWSKQATFSATKREHLSVMTRFPPRFRFWLQFWLGSSTVKDLLRSSRLKICRATVVGLKTCTGYAGLETRGRCCGCWRRRGRQDRTLLYGLMMPMGKKAQGSST